MNNQNRPINFGRVTAATRAMYDILEDGQWHSKKDLQWEGALALIADDYDDAFGRGMALRGASIAAGRIIEDFEIAISGAKDRARNNLDICVRRNRIVRDGDQFRMLPETAFAWRAAHQARLATLPLSAQEHDPLKVRTFAGINEVDAFNAAPVQTRDRVLFRTNYDIARHSFTARMSVSWNFTQDANTGLYRIDGPAGHGRIIEAQVRDWCEEDGIQPSDLRIIPRIKNRNLSDLDPAFLDELVRYYQPFLAKRMRKAMTTIVKHIPEVEDQRQQMGEWVVNSVREYDEAKGVPFGAFLLTRTSHRVHDLTRERLGRTTADLQNLRSKVSNKFTQDYGRNPNRLEFAALMGKTPEEYDTIAATLDRANKVHEAMSIQGMNDDNQDIQIAAENDAATSVLNDSDSAAIAAAVIGACAGKKADEPNLVAFGHLYYKHYSGMTKAQAAEAMKVSGQTITNATERVRPALAAALNSL